MKKLGLIFTAITMMVMLTAMPAPAGDISMEWDAPTTYTDGSVMTPSEIDHFNVYWGTETGVHPNKIELGNVGSYVIQGFSTGTYYIVVTIVSVAGIESDPSNEIVKPIDERKPGSCILRLLN